MSTSPGDALLLLSPILLVILLAGILYGLSKQPRVKTGGVVNSEVRCNFADLRQINSVQEMLQDMPEVNV